MSDAVNYLSKLCVPAEYRCGREHIFPSGTSLDWFIRRNLKTLVDRQALLKPAGRKLIHTERFDEVVLEIGHAAMEAA